MPEFLAIGVGEGALVGRRFGGYLEGATWFPIDDLVVGAVNRVVGGFYSSSIIERECVNVEGMVVFGLAVYVLWVGLTRYRLYGWVLALVGLVLVFGHRNGELGDVAPALVGLGVVSFVVFHGHRLVRRILDWV